MPRSASHREFRASLTSRALSPSVGFPLDPCHGWSCSHHLCVTSPPGMLGDRVRRQTVLRLAGGVGFFSIAATVFVLLWAEQHLRSLMYVLLCVCCAFWGVFMGAHSATLEALFGDSVESGRRSKLYARRAALRNAGNSVGPILSIILFWRIGDDWTIRNLTVVMLSGMAVAVIPCVLLFSLSGATLLCSCPPPLNTHPLPTPGRPAWHRLADLGRPFRVSASARPPSRK